MLAIDLHATYLVLGLLPKLVEAVVLLVTIAICSAHWFECQVQQHEFIGHRRSGNFGMHKPPACFHEIDSLVPRL